MTAIPEEKLRALCEELAPNTQIITIEELTPDASTRSYCRIHLQGYSAKSIVAMCYESLVSPEHDGDQGVSADQAYVSLTKFLAQHKIAVPALLLDARARGVLLLEDVGDRQLAPLLASQNNTERALAREAYKKAITIIRRLQDIPLSGTSVAESRRFSQSAFYNEMKEFYDYLLLPRLEELRQDWEDTARQRFTAEFLQAIDALSRSLMSIPIAFTHRDFHGWNLLLDDEEVVRVIDFQDALMAPRTYDLVGLLHDRDVDTLLGQEYYCALLAEAASLWENCEGLENKAFYREFVVVGLQRDLKVAGRFAKLQQLGRVHYAAWIPGTLRRIGRSLAYLTASAAVEEIQELSSFVEVLPACFTEIAAGMEEGSWF